MNADSSFRTVMVFAFLAACGISFHTNAQQAQGKAAIRVQCDGDNRNAEISINGKFAGDCPFDISVPAGSIKLRAVKRQGDVSERLFEEEFRLAADTVRRVEVQLGSPAPTEAERRRQDKERERAQQERLREEVQARRLESERWLKEENERAREAEAEQKQKRAMEDYRTANPLYCVISAHTTGLFSQEARSDLFELPPVELNAPAALSLLNRFVAQANANGKDKWESGSRAECYSGDKCFVRTSSNHFLNVFCNRDKALATPQKSDPRSEYPVIKFTPNQ